MSDMSYLYYATVTPYKEVLLTLAKVSPANFHMISKMVLKSCSNIGILQIEKALEELKNAGVVVEINSCYIIPEDWLRQLVLFLNEFDQLHSETDNCNAVFNKDQVSKTSSHKFLNKT
ncbi:MAG: hypothetical protein QXM75_03410 [Candidatus Diapherotrites archaeon]